MIDYSDLLECEFAYGGRGPNVFDCYGLAIEIYKRLGIELPDFGTAYYPDTQNDLVETSKLSFKEIFKPEKYCLVTFCVHPRFVSHVGIILPDLNKFIHCIRKIGVCVERLNSPEWNHRIRGFYKWQN